MIETARSSCSVSPAIFRFARSRVAGCLAFLLLTVWAGPAGAQNREQIEAIWGAITKATPSITSISSSCGGSVNISYTLDGDDVLSGHAFGYCAQITVENQEYDVTWGRVRYRTVVNQEYCVSYGSHPNLGGTINRHSIVRARLKASYYPFYSGWSAWSGPFLGCRS